MIGKSMALILAAFVTATAGIAIAKLPPPSDEAKAKVAQAQEKAAAAGKVQAELLGKWQDIAVQKYTAKMKESAAGAKPAAASK
ncbi:MAG: hypothetical protein KJZ83_19820 [Burkholderiaceae bacterium]|nr:hypothetical protein [Burkholderiaceae bacterium]